MVGRVRSTKSKNGKVEYGPFSVQVYVDDVTGVFTANFDDSVYSDKVRDILVERVIEAMKQALDIEWLPYIKVFDIPSKYGICLEISRGWFAEVGGVYRTTTWDVQGERAHERLELSTRLAIEYGVTAIRLPLTQETYTGKFFYLPYSEELWKRLQETAQSIEQTKMSLHTCLFSQEGLDTIVQMGVRFIMDSEVHYESSAKG
jgi:hypothetical protein